MIPRMIAPRDKEEKEGGRTKVVGRLGVILGNIMEVEFMVDEWLQRGLKLSSISMAHAYISWGLHVLYLDLYLILSCLLIEGGL